MIRILVWKTERSTQNILMITYMKTMVIKMKIEKFLNLSVLVQRIQNLLLNNIFFVFYKRDDKFVVDLDVLCRVAVSLPKCKFVCDNKSSYDGKTLEELFFKNKDRYSTFLFVEFVMERLTTKFEPPDFLLQFFVILHLEQVYSKYKMCAKFVFHELFDVYFENKFFDKIFDMLLPKSKYGEEQNGVANFWKDICKPVCDKEYKSMFFCKELWEQKFREKFFNTRLSQNQEEPNSSPASPESQFVTVENLNSME